LRIEVIAQTQGLAFSTVKRSPQPDAILDGEVVALDDEGRMDFRALLASHGWLHYAAFDLL
jgi:ATP-dependent DNA ligase